MNELDKIQSSLASAVSTTMENMTFEEIEIMDEADDIQIVDSDTIWSMLPFQKPHSGELVIQISRSYGKVLAEEVVGLVDDDVSENAINDALAEIANTIAGRFMGALVPENQEFELGLPETGNGSFADQSEVAAAMPLRIGCHAMYVSIVGKDFIDLLEKA